MSGTFARIEKKELQGDRCVAHKIYSELHGKLVYQHFKREISAYKQLQTNHPHLLNLLDYKQIGVNHTLVFDYYEQSLQSFLDQKNQVLAYQCLNQVAKGLAHLHRHEIIHCDLSPSNILIDTKSQRMVICDLGCAHTTSELIDSSQEEIGSRLYKAPEHLFGYKTCRPSTDIWSLGAIFTQLMIGYPVFAGESDIEQIARIVFRLGKPSEAIEKAELSACPDIHKLDFFTDDDCEEEIEFDSEQEYNEFLSIRRPIQILLEQEGLSDKDCSLILRMLTWSMQEREIHFSSILHLFDTNSSDL